MSAPLEGKPQHAGKPGGGRRVADPARYGHTLESWEALPPAERLKIRNRVSVRAYAERNRDRLRERNRAYREKYVGVRADRHYLEERRASLVRQLRRVNEMLGVPAVGNDDGDWDFDPRALDVRP